MPTRTVVLAIVTALTGCGRPLMAAPPPQFAAWGSAGPELPPPPEGWVEVANEPEALPPLTPTADDLRRGYVVFARDPLAPIPPNCVPAPAERADELVTFCALGEYEPLSFGIRALDDLRDVRIEGADLESAQGQTIPRDHVDVRVVRALRVPAGTGGRTYRLQPFLLEKRPSVSISRGATAQAWITVNVPPDAQPGEYRGAVTVRPAAREAMQIPLTVEVLPFVLPPAPIEVGLFVPRPPDDDGLLRRQLIDLREHGMTAIQPTPDAEVVSRDRQFGEDDVAAVRERCTRRMRAFKEVYGDWPFPVTVELGHQIAYYWDPGQNWFAFWPHAPAIETDLLKALQTVLDVAREEGWPPVRVYALDEAGAHNLLDEAVYYYRLLEEHNPELTTWTTIGGGISLGHDEIGQLSGIVDWLSTNRFSPEIARALVDRDRPYGIYNGAGSTPAGARFFFGFHGWKTGADDIMQWTYSFGDNVFAGSGIRAEDEGYVYTASDGPLPSLLWEAAREGVDDYRYLWALWQAVHSGGLPDDAVESARSTLREIMGAIPWTFQAVSTADRTPPPHPSTMRKWRRKVADAILALLESGAHLSPAAAELPRPSPLDWDWSAPEPVALAYGQEMLPPSDFEANMGPWRVESWEGSGSGELDSGTAHGGKQSVRVDVPAAEGNKAVTVVVWPTWGGGGLDLTLDRDHLYEFAAWVRLENRGSPPDLRLSLPAGAERAVASGRGNVGADGWQRIWRRVELDFPAQPRYIAAWVQGPGTIWIDDLSLREAAPPALSVALDQSEYDDLDRVGLATVEISRLVTPASVRFALASAGGEAAGTLTVPFRPQDEVAAEPNRLLSLIAPADLTTCWLALEPASLPVGDYVLNTVLLDAQGAALGEDTVSFRRLPD